MSDEKRGFFRRKTKEAEDLVAQQNAEAAEAVVENPTNASAAKTTISEQQNSADNALLSEGLLGSIAEPVEDSSNSPQQSSTDEVKVFTPRGMDKESPVEEKIHDLKEAAVVHPKKEGWNNTMKDAPMDGTRVVISETGEDEGVLAYWRVSKFVDKKNLRYVPRGRWTDFTTRIDIPFMPKYWKPYVAEEYWRNRGGAPEGKPA